MVSFVIPAHNEAAGLGRTLQAIHDSAEALNLSYEIVVANDASTDDTAEVAAQNGAIVVPVNNRQIAATRNSGGRAAKGEYIFFIDADTLANPGSIAEALRYMENGAAGGGAPALFDDAVPLYIKLGAWLGVLGAKLVGFTGGAFMYCTRAAFLKTGGFDERLFWSEEGKFALALKREGRFVVLWRPVRTSGRRFRSMTGFDVLSIIARVFLSPGKIFTDRAAVAKIWYDSNRSKDNVNPDSFFAHLSNAIALLVILIVFSGPLWNFIPSSWTPDHTLRGHIRFAIQIFDCHVGLTLWFIALVVLRNLMRRQHWIEWLKLAAILAFSIWQGWECTRVVIWYWSALFERLAHH